MARHTRAEIEAFLKDLHEVCERHDIALVATCEAEGILGELTLSRLSDPSDLEWRVWGSYSFYRIPDVSGQWILDGLFPGRRAQEGVV